MFGYIEYNCFEPPPDKVYSVDFVLCLGGFYKAWGGRTTGSISVICPAEKALKYGDILIYNVQNTYSVISFESCGGEKDIDSIEIVFTANSYLACYRWLQRLKNSGGLGIYMIPKLWHFD